MAESRDLFYNLHERKVGHGATEVANDLDRLASKTDHADHSTRTLTQDMRRLDDAVKITKGNIQHLYREVARTGDQSIFGDIRKEEANLRRLQRVAKEIARDVSPGAGRGGVGGALGSFARQADFSQGVSEARGIIISMLIGAAVAAAPTLGAIVAGAVTGAVGTGGIAGGILAASQDAHVKDAARQFGQDISSEFFNSGSSFVGPIIASLDILKKGFEDLDLESLFAKAAPTVTVIAKGFADLARNIMPGLNAAFDRMGPFAQVAAEGFAGLGTAIGQFIADVSKSEGAVEGLATLFHFLNGAIMATGRLLAFLSFAFQDWVDLEIKATDVALAIAAATKDTEGLVVFTNIRRGLEEMKGTALDVPPAIGVAAGAVRGLGTSGDTAAEQLNGATDALNSLIKASNELIPKEFSMAKAKDDLVSATNDLKKQLKEQRDEHVKGAGSLVGFTDAAIENRNKVRDLVASMGELITKTAEEGGNAEKLKRSYKEQLQALGFLPGEIQYYIDQLDRVPIELITKIVIENEQAELKIQETQRELNRIHAPIVDIDADNHLIHLKIQETQRELNRLRLPSLALNFAAPVRSGAGSSSHQLSQFAAGGVTPAFESFKVHAGETLWSDREHYVATAAQTQALAASTAATPGGGAMFNVTPGGGALDRMFVSWLITAVAAEVRHAGGNGSTLGIRSVG